MKRNQIFSGIAISMGMLMLILDGKTAIQGASIGMELCIGTVIPSLFPFFVLSGLLMRCFQGTSSFLLRPLSALCRVPAGMDSILLVAFLGGYPVGAQCAAQAYRKGKIVKEEAEFLLCFCSNAGPSFVFGILGPMFPHWGYAFLLWGTHAVSAVLANLWFCNIRSSAVSVPDKTNLSFAAALQSAIKAMATVCGWVILFRVLLAFLNHWIFWLLPDTVNVFLTGMLELTNGCCGLSMIPSLPLRFTLASVMLSLGGLCVTMQTVSVTQGLSLRQYCLGKLLQCMFSLFLCLGFFYSMWFSVTAILVTILQKLRNNSRFHKVLRV